MGRRSVFLLILAVALGGCSDPKPVDVSQRCDEAWAAFELVTIAHHGEQPTDGQVGADQFTEIDEYALRTLHRCSDPDEWWAGSEPHRARTIGRDAKRGAVLDDWCAAYEEAEPDVCLAR